MRNADRIKWTTVTRPWESEPVRDRTAEHPDLWFLVVLGRLRLDLLNFVNRRSPTSLFVEVERISAA